MTFTEFNKSVFKNNNIKWFDKTGVIKIDNNRRAEIKLSTDNIANQYVKYIVTIIHKENGKITVKEFRFSDYFKNDRIDNRRDYNGCFHAWYNNGDVNWYIAIPSDNNIKNLTSAIMQFINLYR